MSNKLNAKYLRTISRIAAAAERPCAQYKELQQLITKHAVRTKLRACVIVLTPALARAILRDYSLPQNGGRERFKDRLARYAADIRELAWMLNGEALVFDYKGRLLNGYGRLTAIIDESRRSGEDLAIPIVCITGVEPKAVTKFDDTLKREPYQTSQMAASAGVTKDAFTKVEQNLMKSILNPKMGGAGKRRQQDFDTMWSRHGTAVRATIKAFDRVPKTFRRQALRCVAARARYTFPGKAVDEFIQQLGVVSPRPDVEPPRNSKAWLVWSLQQSVLYGHGGSDAVRRRANVEVARAAMWHYLSNEPAPSRGTLPPQPEEIFPLPEEKAAKTVGPMLTVAA